MAAPRSLLLSLLPFAACTARRAVAADFLLYGYASDSNGFPLFSMDGHVYLGDVSQSNSTNAATVSFTYGTNDSLTVSPVNGSTASWSNLLLTLPLYNSTDKRVSLSAAGNTSDDSTTSGFMFYGANVMHKDSNGELSGTFTALPMDDSVSVLYWNDTSLGQQPVIVRTTSPSNPPS